MSNHNPVVYNMPSMAAYTPAETIELVSRAGARKGVMRPDKVFLSATSAGCLLGLSCGATLVALTAPWYQENAPGLMRFLGAVVFPVGLILIL